MGNCLRHEKKISSCDGEDWGSLVSSHSSHEDDDDGTKGPFPPSREVKITISKKELELLIKKVDVQGLSLEQVLLARMVKGGGEVYVAKAEEEHHRPWRPALQSIPEVN